tara:strand:- start:275 stop:529 length:255 start_codon:yes stop_codon:yes gene_type:complete
MIRPFYEGSLICSFYDTLDDALERIAKDAVEDPDLPHQILVDEGSLIVELIKGHVEPFRNHLDLAYDERWKIGKVKEPLINRVL